MSWYCCIRFFLFFLMNFISFAFLYFGRMLDFFFVLSLKEKTNFNISFCISEVRVLDFDRRFHHPQFENFRNSYHFEFFLNAWKNFILLLLLSDLFQFKNNIVIHQFCFRYVLYCKRSMNSFTMTERKSSNYMAYYNLQTLKLL